MDQLLLRLQNSAFAYWLSQGAFPPIITVHSVGMALLVGLQVVINLRVLGLGRAIPIPALRRFMTIVWLGFIANAISGALLFSIYPDKYLVSLQALFHCGGFDYRGVAQPFASECWG
jgi:heme/copper-type cytochrome/quinol oxidase subunit 1